MEQSVNKTAPAENIMGTMPINKLILQLSVPMMISMLVQALYNVVDSIFVSRVSENALTAVSLAFSMQTVMVAVGVGTAVGVNALLSKSLGEKDQDKVNKTAANGIFLAVCSSAVFMLAALLLVRPYFAAQTADPEIARLGEEYTFIVCFFSAGFFNAAMMEKLLASTGKTNYTMLTQLSGAVTNIILDPIFIFGYMGPMFSGSLVWVWACGALPLPPCWGSSFRPGWACTLTLRSTARCSFGSRASGPIWAPSAASIRWAPPALPCSAWAA